MLRELGSRPWLVLGGGGMKGMTHVGAWRRLREKGLAVHGVIGSSIGALVGGCIAAGMDVSDMYRIVQALERDDIIRINRRAAWVNGIKATSVFRGDRLRDYIRDLLPIQRWEDFTMPFQVNAVDLGTGEAVWFGTGARTDVSVVDAVYASAALPVFYPPAEIQGRFYMDGGVDQALPIDRAEAVGATGVLAIDPGSGAHADADEIMGQGMIAIHQRAASIMIRNARKALLAEWNGLPHIVIHPDLDGYGTFDFDSIPYFLEEGYRAAAMTLARIEAGADA